MELKPASPSPDRDRTQPGPPPRFHDINDCPISGPGAGERATACAGRNIGAHTDDGGCAMASDIFSNTTGGVWSLTTNWSAGLPDNNSQVTFADGTYTSTVDSGGAPWTIQSLNVNFSGVTLDVVSDLTAQTLDGNTGAIDVESGATLTLVSMNSSSGAITVSDHGTLIVQNLNNNDGTITAATQGLVDLLSNGAGNFTVTGGILEIGGNYNGTGTITMHGGTLRLVGQLGGSSYSLGGDDKIFLDSPQFTTTNTFTGVNAGDLLGIKGVTITSASYSGTTLTLNTSGGTYTFTNITLAPDAVPGAVFGTTTFEGNSYGYIQLACYCRGTLIQTPDGEMPVEALAIGDQVVTGSGEA